VFRAGYAGAVDVTPLPVVGAPCGIVLAAGAGTRYGGPKALAADADGTPWLDRAVALLAASGCDPVLVTVGAAAAEVARRIPAPGRAVLVPDWNDGLSASVRSALDAAAATGAELAVIVPVDTPTLPAAAVARVLGAAAEAAASALVQATVAGAPSHPVLIGRDHWAEVAATVAGDRGAGPYLAAHGATFVACDDLWDGRDIDERPAP